jgi:hypothetical protein
MRLYNADSCTLAGAKIARWTAPCNYVPDAGQKAKLGGHSKTKDRPVRLTSSSLSGLLHEVPKNTSETTSSTKSSYHQVELLSPPNSPEYSEDIVKYSQPRISLEMFRFDIDVVPNSPGQVASRYPIIETKLSAQSSLSSQQPENRSSSRMDFGPPPFPFPLLDNDELQTLPQIDTPPTLHKIRTTEIAEDFPVMPYPKKESSTEPGVSGHVIVTDTSAALIDFDETQLWVDFDSKTG